MFGVDTADISTVSALLLSTVGMLVLYRNQPPNERAALDSMVGDAGRFGLFLYLLNDLFGITPLSLKASLLLVVFVVATEPVPRYLTKLLKLLQRFLVWLGGKAAALFLLE